MLPAVRKSNQQIRKVMKIKNLLDIVEARSYDGASGIKILNVYDNKVPKKKTLPRLKKGVYGVDSGDGGSGE